MGNTCVGHGCCNPNRNGSGRANRKPLDKPFTDPSPGNFMEILNESPEILSYRLFSLFLCDKHITTLS